MEQELITIPKSLYESLLHDREELIEMKAKEKAEHLNYVQSKIIESIIGKPVWVNPNWQRKISELCTK